MTKIKVSGNKIGAFKSRIGGFRANIRASGPSGARIGVPGEKIGG